MKRSPPVVVTLLKPVLALAMVLGVVADTNAQSDRTSVSEATPLAESITEIVPIDVTLETVVVPERRASLGNSGVAAISETESWVTVGEANVTTAAERRSADGSLFLARVKATPYSATSPTR
ncbi:MAG: hypothetical protein F9B45_21000 [Phycisphaera sp. RhM]|nr:hypothetical protein [Phycisphaera sp. RhM]